MRFKLHESTNVKYLGILSQNFFYLKPVQLQDDMSDLQEAKSVLQDAKSDLQEAKSVLQDAKSVLQDAIDVAKSDLLEFKSPWQLGTFETNFSEN